MKNKLIFVCLALLFGACNATSDPEKNIVITVDVKQIPELGFVISYLRDHMKNIQFDEHGHGECIIEDFDAIHLTLHNGFSERRIIYAEKGDRINLAFDGKSMEKTLVITGGHKTIFDYLQNTKIQWPDEAAYKLDFKEYTACLQQKTDSNLMILNEHRSELEAASKTFVKLEEYRIRCSMSFMLLQYQRGHAWATKNNDFEPGEEYYAELQKWMVEDPDLVDLYEYRTLMTEGAAIIANHRERYTSLYQKTLGQIKYMLSNFKNDRVKQYLTNVLACQYIDVNGIRNIDELNDLYHKNITDPDLITKYNKIYKEWEALSPGQPLPVFTAVDTSGKTHSLKDFQGEKICLYICQAIYPCQKEFPFLDSLQSVFKEYNIGIVCLDIDSKKENWQGITQQSVNLPVTHLYLGNDRNYLRSIRFQGSSMFQFILLDEKGNIIELRLPSPSSGRLANYLQRKLNPTVD